MYKKKKHKNKRTKSLGSHFPQITTESGKKSKKLFKMSKQDLCSLCDSIPMKDSIEILYKVEY